MPKSILAGMIFRDHRMIIPHGDDCLLPHGVLGQVAAAFEADANLAVLTGPAADRWGTWISVLVPVLDDSVRLTDEGVLILDRRAFPASERWVLARDADGNYVMNLGADGKTATLVKQTDGSMLIKTLNGSGDVQIYYPNSYTASTDAATGWTTINLRETDEGIRLRNPVSRLHFD